VRLAVEEFHILSRISELAPSQFCVTVSAVSELNGPTHVRTEVVGSCSDADSRCNYMVMSLATELRASGHLIVGLVE
jgi:hypothetical protein